MLAFAALVAWSVTWIGIDRRERAYVLVVLVLAALAASGLLVQFVVHRSLLAPAWWVLRCAPLAAAAVVLGAELITNDAIDAYAWAAGGGLVLVGVVLLVQGAMERQRSALERTRTVARRNREMFDHAPAALFEVDLSGAWQWLVKNQLIDRTDEVRRWFDEGRPATADALASIVVRDVNFAAVRLVGGADRAAVLADTRLQGAWRYLVEALAKRTRVVECELDVALPSGTRQIILRAELPAPDDLEHCLVYIVDVTKQRQLEEQVRASQRLDSMGKLAGGIAHDFNNLLTVVRMAADRLRRPQLGRVEESPEANIIIDAVARAASLTRQLLLFSRREVSNPKRFVPNEVIEDLSALLRRTMQSIELTIDLDPKLGAVEMDPSQLEQLVLNLAINARDAMPDGGTLRVTTETRHLAPGMVHGIDAGTYVSLRVTDTGCGMDAATRARVFEPFFTTKPAGKGTGLGLSIVYGIARNAGGGVQIESDVGKGTTVEVLLPQVASQATLPRPPRTGELPLGKGERVFFVEDEDALRATTQKTLEDAGYKVTAVRNGPEAIKALAGDVAVDLLISDVVMPVMGGRELVERLRTTRPKLRVLFTSGFVTGVDREQAVEDVAFLAKPYTVGQLLMSVSAALRR
jgi:signal transduction histidine kinase